MVDPMSVSAVRVGIRDGQVVHLKRCARCKETKVARDHPDSEFWVSNRNPDGSVKFWQGYCKACSKERRREYVEANRERVNEQRRKRHRERMETDPAYRERHRVASRAAHLRWMERDPEAEEKLRTAARNYQRRRRAEDPEAVNELARLEYALRAEREGRTVKRSRTVIDGTAPRVDADPFRAWLEAYMAATGLGPQVVAEDLGLVPRRLRGVLAGQAKVAVDVVDRALVAARFPIEVAGRLILRIDDLYDPDVL